MLSLPSGMRRSVNSHNSKVPTFLDWLEAGVLFAEEELSQSEVVDLLVEEQIYRDQNFCSEFVSDAWDQVRRRLSWMSPRSPIRFEDRWIIRQSEWKDVPAYSFCMVVSLGPWYDNWSSFGHDYTEQGLLFEHISKNAMETRFAGWRFFQTGWSRESTAKLPEVVDKLVAAIGERTGLVEDYSSADANEAGVDLVWHLPFVDQRGGVPVYLAQCASGTNWPDKLSEPNLNDWKKIIDFASGPYKAFCLPFALDDKDLRWRSNSIAGLLLDRYRLLALDAPEEEWVSEELRDRLITWLEPRVDWIMDR